MNKKYHYVYRITNTKLNKHYYGVRSSKIEPSKDLGVKYFSSSTDKEFIHDQKINPQNYKYKIVSIFYSRIEASKLEIKLHTKFNVCANESFYNKANAKSTGFDTTGTQHTSVTKNKISNSNSGKIRSKSQRKNISESLTGRKLSEQHAKNMGKSRKGIPRKKYVKDKISKTLKGTKHTAERKSNISKALIGRKLTKEWREKISIGCKNKPPVSKETRMKLSKKLSKPQQQVECPYCNKTGGISNMTRYHFDNCKQNPNN